jgi:hypothetical protein
LPPASISKRKQLNKSFGSILVLRDEYYRLFHRWPVMLAFSHWAACSADCCPFFCRLLPTSRAVLSGWCLPGLFGYKFLALAKRLPNIDNYQCWQMTAEPGSLNDPVLQETLDGTPRPILEAWMCGLVACWI